MNFWVCLSIFAHRSRLYVLSPRIRFCIVAILGAVVVFAIMVKELSAADLPASSHLAAPLRYEAAITRAVTTTQLISTQPFTYQVDTTGTVAPENLYLRIDNLSDAAVVRPQIIVNGRGDWSMIDAMLAEIVTPGMSDEEKAYAIWQFVRDHRYHWAPVQHFGYETWDPVRLFNAYGYGPCGDIAIVMGALWERAGLPARMVTSNPWHQYSEVYYDGEWHLFDADLETLFLRRNNRTVASTADLLADPYLLERSGYAKPWMYTWPTPGYWPISAWYRLGHEINLTLRPRESFIWHWQPLGQFISDVDTAPAEWEWGTEPAPIYANGQLVSVFDPALIDYERWAVRAVNLDTTPALVPSQPDASGELVYRVQSPYPIVGATLDGEFFRTGESDVIEVYATREDPATLLADEIVLPEWRLAYGQLDLPEVVERSNLVGSINTFYEPPLRLENTNAPGILVFKVKRAIGPDNQARPVRLSGLYFSQTLASGTRVAVSRDGANWQTVLETQRYPFWVRLPYTVDVSEAVAGVDEFYVRYELTGDCDHCVGLYNIRLEGVQPTALTPTWTPTATMTETFSTLIDLTPVVNGPHSPAAYEYYLRFVLRSDDDGAVGLNRFVLTTTVQVAPQSLPALSLGTNQVLYTDESDGKSVVQITHGWVETEGVHAPAAPAEPLFPADGETVHTSVPVSLVWQPAVDPDGDQIVQYHIRLCARADCRWPLSSFFDLELPTADPTWPLPMTWLNREQTYYWQVRAQDASGRWSENSPVWSFRLADLPIETVAVDAPATAQIGESVVLTATQVGGSNVAFTWDAGDGTVRAGSIISHTYAAPGTYTLTVTATNEVSIQVIQTVIEVRDSRIEAVELFAPTTVALDETVIMTATQEGGDPALFTWDLGDGTIVSSQVNDTSLLVSMVEHRYTEAGTYTVTVTASNQASSQVAQRRIRVIAPISGLKVTAPVTATVGETLLFTATHASGGDAIFTWDFGDNIQEEGALASHTYLQAGDYTVTLTATNEIGLQRTEHPVRIQDRAIESINVIAPPSIAVNQTVWLTATQSGGTEVTFVWLLGDGTSKEGATISHVYTVPGVYMITVIARNEVSEQTTPLVIEVTDSSNELTPKSWLPLILQ